MISETENCGDFEERVRKMVEAGYETVSREIIVCTRCQLHKNAIKRVIGKGSSDPKSALHRRGTWEKRKNLKRAFHFAEGQEKTWIK